MKATWYDGIGISKTLILEPENDDEEHLLEALYTVANEEKCQKTKQ